jgi:predicted MFS family arabinose efflux permease
MTGCVIAHTGQYALFTYIRPALENIVQLDVDRLSLILLGFGVANFIGTLLAGWLMEKSLRLTQILMPALVGLSALSMILLPLEEAGLMLFVALWGMAFGGLPVAWSNWIARSVPDQAETAGGMVVAAVQSSIAAGAALGGLLFGLSGVTGVFITAGCIMCFAALVIALKVRVALS